MPEQRDARAARRRAHGPNPAASDAATARRWTWEWTKWILIVVGLALLLRTTLVEAFRIPTGSMEPALQVGDFLLVNKAVYGIRVPLTSLRTPAFSEPARGDIIVFAPPHEPDQNYVKRVIGLAGDTVAMRDRTVFINGRALVEPFALYSSSPDVRVTAMDWQCRHAAVAGACLPSRDRWGPVVVPPDHYLVLGDNRDDSEDSRYWGFVDRHALKGRPILVYFSFDPAGAGKAPWATAVRWARLGTPVH